MGALGALVMAGVRRKLSGKLLKQAMDSTTRLSTFVLFILIGSTVFSFTFNAADGHIWVEHLFDDMPGGAMGFLIVVNLLVFVLGCFIDFFEIAFIVVPIIAPVAAKILPSLFPEGTPPDAVMIWFGVVLAMNLQTSFLTPPFGFALFYLRSVAPKQDYRDRLTQALIPAVTTAQIYKGSIAFIALQIVMVIAVIAYPGMVTSAITPATAVDADKALQELFNGPAAVELPAIGDGSGPAGGAGTAPQEDPMKDLLDSVRRDAEKKP
jgi:TRAP-type mannitol/chloroaromatic compound transport system permease large subunit